MGVCQSSLLSAESEAELRRTQHDLIESKAFWATLWQPPYDSCLITEVTEHSDREGSVGDNLNTPGQHSLWEETREVSRVRSKNRKEPFNREVKGTIQSTNPSNQQFFSFVFCRLRKHLSHIKNANLHILLGDNLAALSEYQEALDQYSIGIR